MRKLGLFLGLSVLALGGVTLAQSGAQPGGKSGAPAPAAAAADTPPYWAFPVPSRKWPQPDPAEKVRLPGSRKVFTQAGVNDRFAVPDWYPSDHAAMPSIVSSGRKPDVAACGYCHLPNGQGRPENASLAGQPANYIVQQVREMREGRRKSSESRMGSINAMLSTAKASNDAEVKIAAAYFAKLKYKKWIRVVEADRVPKTEVAQRNMLVVVPGRREAIGKRILEIPENLEHTELRDSRSGFIAYVPKGAIARGKKLVDSGAGAFPCASCHGADFKGVDDVPALAGRSPSGIVRQLYDFKHGTRGGPVAEPMVTEVAHMTSDNFIDIAAYLASLNP